MAWSSPKNNWAAGDGVTNVDMNRIEENVRVLEANSNSLPTTTGTAPTYAVTIADFISLAAGRKITVNFHAATSAAATINVNGLGAKSITKPGGGNPNIKIGAYTLVYNGASFQLLGEGGEYGTAGAAQVLAPYTIGTDAGLVTGTMPKRTNTDTGGSYPVAANQSIYPGMLYLTPPAGYYDGSVWIQSALANMIASNIKKGVEFSPNLIGTLEWDFTALESAMAYLNVSVSVAPTSSISDITKDTEYVYTVGGGLNKFNATTLAKVAENTSSPGAVALAIDDTHVYARGGSNNYNTLIKYSKTDLSYVAETGVIYSGGGGILGVEVDATYVYVLVSMSNFIRIRKFLKSTLAYIGDYDHSGYSATAFTSDADYLYFAHNNYNAFKIAKSTMTLAATNVNVQFVWDMVVNNGTLYMACGNTLKRITVSTFNTSLVDAAITAYTIDTDGIYLYTTDDSNPFTLVKRSLSDLSAVGTLSGISALGSGKHKCAIVGDNICMVNYRNVQRYAKKMYYKNS